MKVFLLCGVPGSGKTWVMDRLEGYGYQLLRNDDYFGPMRDLLVDDVHRAALGGREPVLVDCPFAEREFRAKLVDLEIDVEPIFIVEPPDVVAARYQQRQGKPASKATITRATTILNRADEWQARRGTSKEILELLIGERALFPGRTEAAP